MNGFDTTVNQIVATTTAAGWHSITTGFTTLWVTQIFFGVVIGVAMVLVGIFFRGKIRGSGTVDQPGWAFEMWDYAFNRGWISEDQMNKRGFVPRSKQWDGS